jgi:Glycosyl transferase family 2
MAAFGSMIEISVVVCSHNPRTAYLKRVLEALRNQRLPKEQWELLLIDNASKQPLSATWDLSWHPQARHILEEELGLTAARRRGIRESTGSLLLFVDDDNVLDLNYLSECIRIANEFPLLGAYGSGSIAPEFEVQPSENIKPFLNYLALRDNKAAYWSNVISCEESFPVGAGLCVRSEVAAEYFRFCDESAIQMTDRKGTSLGGHGDYEISFIACRMGKGMGVFTELALVHLIPKERLSEDYFLRLLEGTHMSSALLAYKWRGIHPASPFSPRGMLSVLKNAVTLGSFERRVYFAYLRGTINAGRWVAKLRTDSGQ